jgi:hypothetical protein
MWVCNLSWKAVSEERDGDFGLFICVLLVSASTSEAKTCVISTSTNSICCVRIQRVYVLSYEVRYCTRASWLSRFVVAFPLGSIPSQVMWDLWWKKWHWNKFSRSTSVSPAGSHSFSCSIFLSSGADAIVDSVSLHPRINKSQLLN